MIRRKLVPAVLVFSLASGPRSVPDLDVAVPPGSPLEWGGAFPAYTPPEVPLFPSSGAAEPDPQRTRADLGPRAGALESEVRFAQSFALLRILTWDLTSHLTWITQAPRGPRTGAGASARPPPPRHGDPLYWVGLAPLLRLMLHPEVTHTAEALAHLVELGEPLLPVLAAAAAEASLAPHVQRLTALVPAAPEVPLPTFDGPLRRRVLARFTLEECLREEPYDPVGEFGKRLFLFHEEVEPILVEFTRHPALALRRNAVAALARYRTRTAAEALARCAVEERDPVALVRALAALGGFRGKLDEAPLLARARAEEDPVLRAAWLGALGRLGARSAVPWLLEEGARALEQRDGELLISVLSALARIPPTAERARVRLLAEKVRAEVRGESGPWRAPGPRSSERADLPDASDTRARWLDDLATLTRVASDPLGPEAADTLLGLARPGARDGRVAAGESGSDPLASLVPALHALYLDTLDEIGAPGLERLAALALDPGLEAGLRGRALALSPFDRRATLAARFVEPGQRDELCIQGFEVLRLDRRAELAARAAERVRELVAGGTLEADAPRRYLWTQALRARPAGTAFDSAELLTLWNALRASPALQRALRQRAATRLEALLGAALGGVRGETLAQEADAWLELVAPLGPERDARARKEARALLLEALGEARKHRGEEGHADELVRRLLREHTGHAPPAVARGGHFEPSVPLEEELVLTLGRTRAPAALEVLLQLLALPENDLRGELCLALALGGERALAGQLVARLEDPEPFVRLCAGEALRALVGHEFEHDWVHGPEDERVQRARLLAEALARSAR